MPNKPSSRSNSSICSILVKFFLISQLLMELEAWKSLSWWNDNIQQGLLTVDKIKSESVQKPQITRIEQLGGVVAQRNCQVVPFEVFFGDNEEKISVVVKEVYLPLSKFRSVEHQQRTKQSHIIETNFYSECSKFINKDQIRVPEIYMSHWFSEDLLILIEEDVRTTKDISSETKRGVEQRISLSLSETWLALEWLGSWHTSFYDIPLELPGEKSLWEQGGYWSLEKRHTDLDSMVGGWKSTVEAFAAVDEVFSTEPAQNLAVTLRGLASTLHGLLNADTEGRTLLHGDFKTANLFFRKADGKVAAVDYQWVGAGLGVQDIVYLLFSSVDPEVIYQHEEALLAHYYQSLQENLQANGKSPMAYDRFIEQYEIAFLDYVRYLISTMWGNFSPEKSATFNGQINHGMHKREPQLLAHMVKKAVALVDKVGLEQKVPVALKLAESAVVLAEAAGKIIKEIIAEGRHVSSATDKNCKDTEQGNGPIMNPQTIADITAERHITQSFKESFPKVLVIGEEMMETGPQTGEGVEVPETAQQFGYSGLDLLALSASLPEELKGDLDLSDVTVWVDPLDGTKEMLLEALENVTTLIGIALKGRPIFGVIHQPFGGKFGKTFAGGLCSGQVAFSRDSPLAQMSKLEWKPMDSSDVVVSCSRGKVSEQVERFNPSKIIQHGGAGRHYLNLLEQRTSLWIHVNSHASRWDTCAGEALLGTFGGITKDRVNRCDYHYLAPDPKKPETFKNLGGVVAAASELLLQQYFSSQQHGNATAEDATTCQENSLDTPNHIDKKSKMS